MSGLGCIDSIYVHNTHIMATVAILARRATPGRRRSTACSRHPELELVALGSDSLAGTAGARARPAARTATCPMFVPNLEAAASGAEVIFLCLGNNEAAAFEPPTAPSWSTSPASTGSPTPPSPTQWYGLAPGAWSYGLPEVHPADGPADREPRLLRDCRRCSRSRRCAASIAGDVIVEPSRG